MGIFNSTRTLLSMTITDNGEDTVVHVKVKGSKDQIVDAFRGVLEDTSGNAKEFQEVIAEATKKSKRKSSLTKKTTKKKGK